MSKVNEIILKILITWIAAMVAIGATVFAAWIAWTFMVSTSIGG